MRPRYDVWRPYVNKRASGTEVVLVSRIVVMVYGVLSGLLAIILLRLGLNLGGWVRACTCVCVCLCVCSHVSMSLSFVLLNCSTSFAERTCV